MIILGNFSGLISKSEQHLVREVSLLTQCASLPFCIDLVGMSASLFGQSQRSRTPMSVACRLWRNYFG